MGPSRRIQWRAPAAMTVLPHGRSGQGTPSGRVAGPGTGSPAGVGPGTGDPGPVPVAEAAVAEAPVAVAEAAVAEAAEAGRGKQLLPLVIKRRPELLRRLPVCATLSVLTGAR